MVIISRSTKPKWTEHTVRELSVPLSSITGYGVFACGHLAHLVFSSPSHFIAAKKQQWNSSATKSISKIQIHFEAAGWEKLREAVTYILHPRPDYTCSIMNWFRAVGDVVNPYTLQSYPRPIPPQFPDFIQCAPEFGRELTKNDCKEAVKNMPWAREGLDVEWSVNFHAQQYNLPMSIGWTIPKPSALAGTPGM